MSTQPTIAFLGPEASYTHQATLSLFPGAENILSPQITIEDVFIAVQNDRATYGVVPFENSSNGSVVFTLDLFRDLAGRFEDLVVCREWFVDVRHCLVGRRGPVVSGKECTPAARASTSTPTPTEEPPKPTPPPASNLSHIQKLYSHPQAWGQCTQFLTTYLHGIERQDVSSTSRAAELVAQDESATSAAISSRVAAELNGLDVLVEGIEDLRGNQTRFLVLRKRTGPTTTSSTSTNTTARSVATSSTSSDKPQDDTQEETEEETDEKKTYKTLITFTLEHGEPGALATCLAVFKTHHLNLTSINTRPSGERPWHYVFFVEFMGRKRTEEEGGAVNEALRDLDRVAKSWRWLGSWANANFSSVL